MSNRKKSFILRVFFPVSVLLLILWACNQVTTNESYLNLSKLYDSLKVYDSVHVFVMDKDGNVLDTAFHGALDSKEDLTNLSVPHYHGEDAIISVLGFNKDKVVYESRRYYNGAKGKTDSIVPIILPTSSITLTATDTQVTEGDSVPLPTFTVLPPELSDKTVLWYSSDSHFVSLTSSHYRGVKAGTAMLWARLKSNPAKQAGFSVQVLAKPRGKAPDSLSLSPDTLRVAAKGAPGQFTLKISPTSASASVSWVSLDSTITHVSQDGLVQGIKEGQVRIRVTSKEDAQISDTALVLVSAEVKIDSVRFVLDSMNLFIGGVSENLVVKVFPPSANQEVAIQVMHPLIATLDQGKLKGVKEGSTFAIATSKQDGSKVDTLFVSVTEAQKIDSIITMPDTLHLYIGGKDSVIRASVYPTKASQSVHWQSSTSEIALVEESGKVSPNKPGKTFVVAVSRADSTRKDSSLVIVKKDTPRLNVGPDTILAVGSTLAFSPKVSQEYGSVVQFKWDLDGDGAWDDSAASVDFLKIQLFRRYDKEEEVQARFYVKDSEGNDTIVVRKVKAVIGPVIRILTPADNSATNQTVIDVTWSVDGVLQTTFTKQDLVNGPNTVTRKVKDGSGKEFAASITIVLDTLPPGKPVLHGPTPVNTQLPTWTWESGGGGNGTYRYRLDDQDMSGATLLKDTTFTPAKKLTEEVHTLFVQEQDAAGNWSAIGRLAVTIDLTSPTAPKVSVKQSSPSNEPKPTWTWVSGGGEGMGLFRYRLDNSDLSRSAIVDTVLTFTPTDTLSNGEHVLFVQERDSAGNWSVPGNAILFLDFDPPNAPKVSVTPASPTNNPKPTWGWVSGENGGTGVFRFRLDTLELSGAPNGTVTSFTPLTNLIEGTHVLYVQEKDSAGNWSESSTSTILIDLTPPNAPIFEMTPLSPLNSLKPTWTWKSGGNGGKGVYRCRLDDTVSPSKDTILSSEQFMPFGNLAEGMHTLFVQEQDSVGNWSLSHSKSLVLSLRGYVGKSGLSAWGADFISMALSSSGVPYIAFRDEGNGYKTTVMRLNAGGTAWEILGGSGFSSGEVNTVSMALSNAGVPYVAFADAANGDKVTVMRLNAMESSWELVGNIGFPLETTYFSSIALNNEGVPYIAYRIADSGKIRVLRLASSGKVWETVGDALISGFYSDPPSIAFSETGKLFLAFQVEAVGGKINVATFNQESNYWEYAGKQISPLYGKSPSIAISGEGTPYVAFGDGANGGRATVMRLNATKSTWETVGSSGFSVGLPITPSLGLNSAGCPYVAFADEGNGELVTVVRLDASGTTWEKVGVAGFPPGRASFTSIAISKLGVPYVAFKDWLNDGKASVIRTSFNP